MPRFIPKGAVTLAPNSVAQLEEIAKRLMDLSDAMRRVRTLKPVSDQLLEQARAIEGLLKNPELEATLPKMPLSAATRSALELPRVDQLFGEPYISDQQQLFNALAMGLDGSYGRGGSVRLGITDASHAGRGRIDVMGRFLRNDKNAGDAKFRLFTMGSGGFGRDSGKELGAEINYLRLRRSGARTDADVFADLHEKLMRWFELSGVRSVHATLKGEFVLEALKGYPYVFDPQSTSNMRNLLAHARDVSLRDNASNREHYLPLMRALQNERESPMATLANVAANFPELLPRPPKIDSQGWDVLLRLA